MRIEAHDRKGELGHVGSSGEYRAGRLQPADHRRVLSGGRGIIESLGPRERDFTRHIQHVLHGDRNAGDWRRRVTDLAKAILRLGYGTRLVRPYLDEGSLAFASGIGDPRQALLGKRLARYRTGNKGAGAIEDSRSDAAGFGRTVACQRILHTRFSFRDP